MIQPTVAVGGQQANITFAALMPGAVGLFQIELTVPTGLTSGDQPVVITQGGVAANVALLGVHQRSLLVLRFFDQTKRTGYGTPMNADKRG